MYPECEFFIFKNKIIFEKKVNFYYYRISEEEDQYTSTSKKFDQKKINAKVI
jgi:hypothetical protein